MSNKRTRIGLALAAAGALAVTAGCAATTPTNTPQPQGPALAFDKLAVDLGTVPRDQEGIATFLVANFGKQAAEVGPATVRVEEGCDAVESAQKTASVGPNEVMLLPVRYGKHQQSGPHRFLVDVRSTDPAKSMTVLTVRFTVDETEEAAPAGPRLRVDKTFIDSGTVPHDWPAYEQFTLRNTGDAPLIIEGKPVLRIVEGC